MSRIKHALGAGLATLRMLGVKPSDIAEGALEWLSELCIDYGIDNPVGQFQAAYERVARQRGVTAQPLVTVVRRQPVKR